MWHIFNLKSRFINFIICHSYLKMLISMFNYYLVSMRAVNITDKILSKMVRKGWLCNFNRHLFLLSSTCDIRVSSFVVRLHKTLLFWECPFPYIYVIFFCYFWNSLGVYMTVFNIKITETWFENVYTISLHWKPNNPEDRILVSMKINCQVILDERYSDVLYIYTHNTQPFLYIWS